MQQSLSAAAEMDVLRLCLVLACCLFAGREPLLQRRVIAAGLCCNEEMLQNKTGRSVALLDQSLLMKSDRPLIWPSSCKCPAIADNAVSMLLSRNPKGQQQAR